jgi:hypothetical protein
MLRQWLQQIAFRMDIAVFDGNREEAGKKCLSLTIAASSALSADCSPAD